MCEKAINTMFIFAIWKGKTMVFV